MMSNWFKMNLISWSNWMKKKNIINSRIKSLSISKIISKSGKSMLKSNHLLFTILQKSVWHVAKSLYSKSCFLNKIWNRISSFPTPLFWSLKSIVLIQLKSLNSFMRKMFNWVMMRMNKWKMTIIKLSLRNVIIQNNQPI